MRLAKLLQRSALLLVIRKISKLVKRHHDEMSAFPTARGLGLHLHLVLPHCTPTDAPHNVPRIANTRRGGPDSRVRAAERRLLCQHGRKFNHIVAAGDGRLRDRERQHPEAVKSSHIPTSQEQGPVRGEQSRRALASLLRLRRSNAPPAYPNQFENISIHTARSNLTPSKSKRV
jgi:hypothetical protein